MRIWTIAILTLTTATMATAVDGATARSTADADVRLADELTRAARQAGDSSGYYVFNLSDGRPLFARRATRRRILASNAKLFTAAAALAQSGPTGVVATELLGRGTFDPATGIYDGDLYLRGGGDPTLGTERFVRRWYGDGTAIEGIADRVAALGIKTVTGTIYGDETAFDRRRGTTYSRFRISGDIGGQLSGLSVNRGFADIRGLAYQSNPPVFAADLLVDALEADGVEADRTGSAAAPTQATVITSVTSPPLSRIATLMNRPSDNFVAETLVKRLALGAGAPATTTAGAAIARAYARNIGARAGLVDGSGLSRGNRASPAAVVSLLRAMAARSEGPALHDSLAEPGKRGTLSRRMRNSVAAGRCRAKTGTLHDVSTLSGYCATVGGDKVAFSFLMNRVSPPAARAIQDRMTIAIARYDG